MDRNFQTLETPPFLHVARASLRGADGLVFRDTEWRWAEGQQWALIGPNGSGKSLLARALAGGVPVVRGELRYGFEPPPGRAVEDTVALVSFEQQHDLALDGIPASRWFSLEHADVPSVTDFLSRERVERINPFQVDGPPVRSPATFARDRRHVLNLLGIEDLAERDLLALSSGERRKVLIARALLERPKLLILDDPFAGLDAASRRHFRHVIDRLIRDERIHVLLIAMRPEELPRGITHVLEVRGCRVVAQGPRTAFRLTSASRSAAWPSHAAIVKPGKECIRLDQVTVRYGRREILRDVSWTVREGERWAILGPNGSGKTTLLSLVTGDNPQAYANDVRLFGRQRGDGESVWDLRRRIGVVSPDIHLSCDTELTCRDIACADDDPEGAKGLRERRRAAGRWLARLGLKAHALKSFGSLSPGRQRMVLLARALARQPALLVLDEPCQGLDERQRRAFVLAVERVMRRTNITILYVTHHLDEIPSGIAHVLRLKDGVARRSLRR